MHFSEARQQWEHTREEEELCGMENSPPQNIPPSFLAAVRRTEADRDVITTALALKPGDAVDGIGVLSKKGVENGMFVWWVAGSGGCISLNNLIGHLRSRVSR